MSNFENQIVIVTGGTRGIGAGITKAFLSKGATVIASYVGNDAAAADFRGQNESYGEKLDIYKFDVSDAEQVEKFFEYVMEKYQSVDVLINNCGIRKDGLLVMMSNDDWDSVLDINLKGTFLMSKAAVRIFMRKRFGRIVNVSSIGGSLGLPGQANYTASKAGQVAISKSLSKEVAKKGITVNNVCPGFIDTELIADLPEEQRKEYAKQVPMKRFGKVEEVANAILFLSSKEASYITGASLEIAGGL